jgi:hypothetical protein
VVGLDEPQTPLEIAGLDRPDKGVDHQSRGRPTGLPDRPVANRSRRSRTPCSSCFIRPRSGTANSVAIVAASPGVITPPASAEVTAFIAAAMSWAFSPRALFRGSTLDRRQSELHDAIAARRQNAFEAQPLRCRVADQRQLDGPAGQGLGLAY